MLNTLLGSKEKMSQAFVEDTRVPVTWVKVGPCTITQIKSEDKDGYWAVQLGFGERKTKNTPKPILGHIRGAYKDNKAPRFLREVKLSEKPEFGVGDKITITDVFKRGDMVAVTGTSKGKGFAGVVKRWRFKGGPKTHGQSDRQRAPGSIGQGTTPGRVYKGKKMAGRMGNDTVTVKNLIVVKVDEVNEKLALSGPVPGKPDGLLMIKKLASGKLEELVEEAPQIEVQQEVEEVTAGDAKENQKEVEVKEEKENA